jgi:hypothetical protein
MTQMLLWSSPLIVAGCIAALVLPDQAAIVPFAQTVLVIIEVIGIAVGPIDPAPGRRGAVMPWWTPLAMVGGFLAFGVIVVVYSDISDALSRWTERRKRK